MDRTVHEAHSHEEADRWDVEQHVAMTHEERLRAARELKDRAFSSSAKDVREWHRSDELVKNKETAARPNDLNNLSYLRGTKGG